MEVNETLLGIVNILVMLASLAWMMSWGIGGGEKLIPLTVFSVSFTVALVFFPEWFGEKV